MNQASARQSQGVDYLRHLRADMSDMLDTVVIAASGEHFPAHSQVSSLHVLCFELSARVEVRKGVDAGSSADSFIATCLCSCCSPIHSSLRG